MNYLTTACIAKDEDLYLEEWVNFHRAVGSEHIYIYDNESKVAIKQLLSKYIDAGVVTVIEMAGRHIQMDAYDHCLKNFGPTSKWISFIDVDEFLVPKSANTLPEILSEYEQYGGLASHWIWYGSGGLVHRPEGLVIENFTKAAPKNWCMHRHVKSIVQPERTKSHGDPHWFEYNEPYHAVLENHVKIDRSIAFPCTSCGKPNILENHDCGGEVNVNKIQTNHYFTKSFNEFMIRHYRGMAYTHSETRSSIAGYEKVTRVCDVESKDAAKFADKVKSLYIK